MIAAALTRRAAELDARGAPFVVATVVRAQRPTSARAGDVALVLGDGTMEGFVGGTCAEQTVRVHALRALETGKPVLLRILPDGARDAGEAEEIASEGAVTVQNPCLSGGAIEVFLEPMLPAARLHVVGTTPIAAAVQRLGSELGLDVVAVGDGAPELADGDLALVVAAHGRGELGALELGLEAELPYVGLVASEIRGAAIIEELRAAGVSAERLAVLDTPAGIEIGASTPAEIALSILARIVAVRRGRDSREPAATEEPPTPSTAVDPICQMTVVAVADTPQLEHEGRTVYFCSEHCKATFQQERFGAVPAR